jgi:hypothetical protein
MFCAKCGNELTIGERGNFSCPSGLDFSIRLSELLREHYRRDVPKHAVASPSAIPSRWFCPECGVRMGSPDQPCSACGRSLTKPIVFQLIEFHPHPDGRGSFY